MRRLAGLLSAAAVLGSLGTAEAKSARCFTTDDGTYACDFRATARDGSFEISAPGKPTFRLEIIEPDVAQGFVNFGPRDIFLPGRYLRSRTDRACWENDSTGAMVCAW